MTAIAGFVHDDGKVWIGGDSAGIGGWDLTIRSDPKVFRNGDFLFGFTSSFRMGQLLRYKFQPPERYDQEVFSFMVTSFVDSVRDCLKSGGSAKKELEVESAGTFLVGYSGRLFTIDSDYQVGESADRYDACGSGVQVVRGALFASRVGIGPEDRMNLVLAAAERHCAGVRGPFTVMSV